MQKNQILQEYLFMERVNAFLEEKLTTLPVPANLDRLLKKRAANINSSDSDKREEHLHRPRLPSSSSSLTSSNSSAGAVKESASSSTVNKKSSSSLAGTAKSKTTGGNSKSDKNVASYHHGRYLASNDDEIEAIKLSTEQQSTISCLTQLGIDPINGITSIREHLEIIEMQVQERQRQLNDENQTLSGKLADLMSGLEAVKASTSNDL